MSDSKRGLSRRLGPSFAAGLAIGGTIAYFAVGDLIALPPADIASLGIALLLFCAGLYAVWVSADGGRFKRVIEKRDDGEPVDHLALRTARQSGAVCLLAAAILAIPPLVAGQETTQPLRSMVFAGVLLLLAVETWGNWRIWRDGDELTRAVVLTTAAVCFLIGQFVLFVWAALAKLALIPDTGSWSIFTAWMALYLIASVVVSVRRGFNHIG